MHTIFCVPDSFISPQIYFCHKLKQKFEIKTANLDQLIHKNIQNSAYTSLVFDIDNPKIDSRLLSVLLKNGYDECISLAIKRSPSTNNGFWQGLYVFDDVVQIQSDIQAELSGLCNKISYLYQLKKIHQEIGQKLRRRLIIGKSDAIRELVLKIPRYANSDSTILITGETGTGKELFARAFHYLGKRSEKPFVTVDCSTLPESLIENELFGHTKGAYTNAVSAQQGSLEQAQSGTVFLDEIESLPYSVQSKLLRFMQEREVKPVGGAGYKKIDARIIVASNENLLERVKQKTFRRDLYYRLSVARIDLPPLRERKTDIPLLADFFLKKYSNNATSLADVSQQHLDQWLCCEWRGNARELENRIQEYVLNKNEYHSNGEWPEAEETVEPPATLNAFEPLKKYRERLLRQYERPYLVRLLEHTRGNLGNAARIAEMNRKNFSLLLKKYNIDPGDLKRAPKMGR